MTQALYQISNQYQQKFDRLEAYYDDCESYDDDIANSLWIDLQDIEEAFEDKAIAVASYIKNLEAELLMIRNAVCEMEDRELKVRKKIENQKRYLMEELQAANISEVKKSPHFVIKLKKNPPSVDVTDEALIPKEYIVTKQVESISKAEILKDLKDGLFIPGATLKQTIKLEIK